MSKRINVNPDHYKVAGRERPGEDVAASENKQKFGTVQHELASRAEQRNRSLESMRGEKAQQARDASPGRSAQARGKKKTVKTAPRTPEDEEGEGRGESRRRVPLAAGVTRIAAAGASRVSGMPSTKRVVRKAKRTAKTTRRAAVTLRSTTVSAAKKAAARAKKAVTPRPKQALPKKRAAPTGGTSRPGGRSGARRASRKK